MMSGYIFTGKDAYMNFISRITMRNQLNTLLILPICAFVFLLFGMKVSLDKASDSDAMVEHTFEVIGLIDQTLTDFVNMETGYRGYLITGREEFLEPYHLGMESAARHINILLEKTADNPNQTERFLKLQSTYVSWNDEVLLKGISIHNSAPNYQKARDYVLAGLGKRYLDSMRDIINSAREEEVVLKKARRDELVENEANVWFFSLFIIVVFSCLSITFSLFVNSFFSKKIKELQIGMSHLSKGDLSYHINNPVASKNELISLIGHYNATVGSLVSLLKGSLVSIQSMNDSTSSIYLKTQSNHEAIEEQSSNIEVTVTAINEMEATISEVASNASDANTAINDSLGEVESGQVVVRDMGEDMQSLKDTFISTSESIDNLSSQVNRISTTLSSMKDIAEQTNLLALNAAIEAARAGEAGRGFAVVADEVRVLATKSQTFASNINEIITELQGESSDTTDRMTLSLEKINTCEERMGEVSLQFSSIRTNHERLSDVMSMVATATEEQATTMREINKNTMLISDMSRSSQEQSSLVLQDIDLIKAESNHLNENMSFLRVG
jgi:methyl-accepting chemotaxis protein